MIHFELRTPSTSTAATDGWTSIASIIVHDDGHAVISDPQKLLDTAAVHPTPRSDTGVRYSENIEEWARAAAHSFNAPDLLAFMRADTNPWPIPEYEDLSPSFDDNVIEVAPAGGRLACRSAPGRARHRALMPRTTTSSAGSLVAGAALRKARTDAGLTQADVARTVGTSAPYIANVEGGRENLTIGRLATIADALGHELQISLAPVEDLSPVIDGV